VTDIGPSVKAVTPFPQSETVMACVDKARASKVTGEIILLE
jgi:hypothetical protein